MFIDTPDKSEQLLANLLEAKNITNHGLNVRSELLNKLGMLIRKKAIDHKDKELLALSNYFLEVSDYKKIIGNKILQPRGLVFHIPSSNITYMPFYSWATSFLVGNINVVRLSRRANLNSLRLILNFFSSVSSKLYVNQYFVLPDYFNSIMNGCLGSIDLRLIWGNRDTISTIRKDSPLSIGLDLSFPDRYSACLISSNYYKVASDTQISQICKLFQNDSLDGSFGACSSPHLLIWISEESPSSDNFPLLYDLNTFIKNDVQEYGSISTENIRKFQESIITNDFSFKYLALGKYKGRPFLLYQDDLKLLPTFLQNASQSATIVLYIKSISEIKNVLPKNIQSMTYSPGISSEELSSLVADLDSNLPDRIIPLGRALDFDVVWDGYNLLEIFGRLVTFK